LALRSLGLSPGCRGCGALTGTGGPGPGDGAQLNPYEPTAPETGPKSIRTSQRPRRRGRWRGRRGTASC
jgi:hypothetical protein